MNNQSPFTGIKALVMPFWVTGYIKNRRSVEITCQSEESALGEYLTLNTKYKSAFIRKITPPNIGTIGGIDRTTKWDRK